MKNRNQILHAFLLFSSFYSSPLSFSLQSSDCKNCIGIFKNLKTKMSKHLFIFTPSHYIINNVHRNQLIGVFLL